MNLYAYCGNNPVMGYDPDGTFDWGSFWKGVGLVAIGVGAIATGILTLPFGGGIAIVAGITVVAGVGTTAFGLSNIGEGFSGYNLIQETIFGGNEQAYDITENIFKYTAIVGSTICGIYGATHTSISSARSTPRLGESHSAIYNKQFKTLTYYGKDDQMKYSMHLFNRGHQWIHWHSEMPHSEPINNVFKFIYEMIKRGF